MLFLNKKKEADDGLSQEEKFDSWLDNVLDKKLPSSIVAINFNIYEDENNNWSIELVGSPNFSEEDEDWACDEVYTTRNNPFVINMESDWKVVEKLFINYLKNYLEKGNNSYKLKQYEAVAVGFADGDLNIIYKKTL